MTTVPGPGYYENTRADLIPMIEASRRRVLDVGCGAGRLGAALKALVPGREVHGVELVEEAARKARQLLDSVLIGDIQTMTLPFAPESFDCVVFADVLEHLVDPGAVLRKVRPLVRPDGIIVCSIPNMRHYTVLVRLITRGWQYDEYGLFDRTHLRFYSLRTMKELLTANGWEIVSITPRIVASRKARLLNALAAGRLEEFVSLGYILCARRTA